MRIRSFVSAQLGAVVVVALSAVGAMHAAHAQTQEPVKRPAPSKETAPLPQGCRWKEQEYRDDVRITTCNAASTIFIRAMSMGPGFCAVEVRTKSTAPERIGITSVPGVFSGWMALVSHLGVYSIGIANDVKCDTGVRTQVRYSAPE